MMRMKTTKRLTLIAVFSAMLCSCGSLFQTVADQAAAIQPGMSKQEVVNILGQSKYKSLDRNFEQWEYRTQLNNGDFDVVKIEFKDGCVIRMDSYREVLHHFPEPPHKK